jgi:SdpC family antimicrobial peptide
MFTTPTKLTKCIALGLAISVTACQTNLVQEVMPKSSIFSNGRTETVKSYSGEELFRGIFMAEGEVADKLSIFDKMPIRQQLESNDSLRTKYKAELDEIVALIQVNKPNFFGDFEREITSGNVLRVQNAVNNGAKILIQSMMKLPKYEKALEKTGNIVSKIDIQEISTPDGKVDMSKLQEIINKQKLEDSVNPQCVGEAVAVFCVIAIYGIIAMDFGVVWNAGVLVNGAVLVNIWAGTNATVDWGDFLCQDVLDSGDGEKEIGGEILKTTNRGNPKTRTKNTSLQSEVFLQELTLTFRK